MIDFKNKIVQFGFGAVGKSFFEKVSKEIKFNENNYFVLSKDKFEFDAFIDLGGIVSNFLVYDVTRDNFSSIFTYTHTSSPSFAQVVFGSLLFCIFTKVAFGAVLS